ncbi:MAG: hypothetical protein JJU11_07330 [Candidatus Sumerlaeia bacterium]|nr:hypothetical protein [Candidatus Sumerlaeia bacterium]
MAKKGGNAATYFINRRVELTAQALYIVGIFFFIPGWFMGRDLEERGPLLAATVIGAILLFALLFLPITFLFKKWKIRSETTKTFLGAFGFCLLPICLGLIPVVNSWGERGESETVEALILTTYGEPGTEERVNLAGSATALVEFDDGTRRRFSIRDADYDRVVARQSKLEITRRTGLFGLVWLDAGAVADDPEQDEDAGEPAEDDQP